MGDRVRAYDLQWRLIWDSETATTSLWQHMSSECHATIDYPDGRRWSGMFYRCPEGVKRWECPDLGRFLDWPSYGGDE